MQIASIFLAWLLRCKSSTVFVIRLQRVLKPVIELTNATTQGLSLPHLMCWQTEVTSTTARGRCVILSPDTKLPTYLLTYPRIIRRDVRMFTKCWQVISVIHFSISSRDTLDVDWAFVSTTVVVSSAWVPFDCDETAKWRTVSRVFNGRYISLLSINSKPYNSNKFQ